MITKSIVSNLPRVELVRHVVLILIEYYNEYINKTDKKRERLTSLKEKLLRFAERDERWKRDSFYSFRLTVDRSTPISFSHLLEAYTVEPLYTDTKTKKGFKRKILVESWLLRQYEGNDFRESRLKREMVPIRVVSDRGFNCTLKKQTAMRITAIECNTDYDNFGSLIVFISLLLLAELWHWSLQSLFLNVYL